MFLHLRDDGLNFVLVPAPGVPPIRNCVSLYFQKDYPFVCATFFRDKLYHNTPAKKVAHTKVWWFRKYREKIMKLNLSRVQYKGAGRARAHIPYPDC